MGTATNTTVTAFNASVKVMKVEILTPPASQGANATCSVEWAGSVNSPDREFSDTSVSTATPAHVSTTPPAQSLASFWQTASTGTLFLITAPTGSIIDIVLSLINADGATTATSTVATAVIGTVYYMSLDPNATHRFTPVSLTSTV